nr:RagB/SusD family nutrient uptake outer membrane protein [uncultured Chitinophaga sp.]
MRTYGFYILLMLTLFGCVKSNDDFLDRSPSNILLDEQVWKDEVLVLSLIADLYNRYPDYQTIENWSEFAAFDEAFASESGQYGRHKNQQYGYGAWGFWDYGYVRALNLFIEKCAKANQLKPESRDRFLAEARFLRANVYFELVKRMGGVPLVLEPLTYDYKGDPSALRRPREKESAIYDFVLKEMDAVMQVLPDDANIKSRATKGLALAVKARAALYAAAIAKYGASTPQVSLPGGEVGIPASMAAGYYQTALNAARQLINSGKYALYNKKPDNLSDNFAALFYDKGGNPEVIFVKDFKLQSGTVQEWTLANQPRSLAEEQQGGRLNPSLNLVQSFEKLDNTFAPYQTNAANGDYIYYDKPEDMFAGRDARLAGTVILPGTEFKSKKVDIWAGYILKDGSIVTANNFGGQAMLGGNRVQVVGFDGPIDNLEFSAQTGFYVRKYQDPAVGSGRIGTKSEVWWVRYRYAEVLLNAAEAAFELGDPNTAAGYLNQVRARAGFTIPLTPADVTFDRIVHERRVELAFEGHQLWDMKRWRLAHVVWDGLSTDLTTHPENARSTSTRVFGLLPYRIYNPGTPQDGKWVFKKVMPSNVTSAHRFRLGNYYSYIGDDVRNNNPLVTKNPNQ